MQGNFIRLQTTILNLMKGSPKTICIEKKVPIEIAASIKKIKRTGFFYKEESTRVFHYDNLASHF